MTDYGLPEPHNLAAELSRELLRFDANKERAWIGQQPAPSEEQQAVLDAVVHAFTHDECLLLFCKAKAARGRLG